MPQNCPLSCPDSAQGKSTASCTHQSTQHHIPRESFRLTLLSANVVSCFTLFTPLPSVQYALHPAVNLTSRQPGCRIPRFQPLIRLSGIFPLPFPWRQATGAGAHPTPPVTSNSVGWHATPPSVADPLKIPDLAAFFLVILVNVNWWWGWREDPPTCIPPPPPCNDH